MNFFVDVVSPFPEAAVPRIWGWIETFRDRVCDDSAPKTLHGFVEQWIAREATQQSWGVSVDGELGGVVTAQPVTGVVTEAHCMFKRSFWGTGIPGEALRKIYGQLFDAGTQKIIMAPFRDNAQMLGLARKLGGKKEAVLRQHAMRGGRLVDQVVVGFTRADFNGKAIGHPTASVVSQQGGHA